MILRRPRPESKLSYCFYPTRQSKSGINRKGMRFHFHKDVDLKSFIVQNLMEEYHAKDYAIENVYIQGNDLIIDMYHFIRIGKKVQCGQY